MKTVRIHEAKTHFSQLLREVEEGEEIVVQRGSQPVAKLVPYRSATGDRVPGALKGRIWMSDDFDAIPEGFEDYVE